MKTPMQELIESIVYEHKGVVRIQLMRDTLDSLIEKEKQMVIDAFRKGRKAGAIFKRAKDNEGFAEQYYKETFK